ncbi:MAG: hypothetical protein OXD32_07785 [Endozoicomonadaceae bacterium]|nr:hypothetical protein [Endozoicomonadaceae bacterium]
MIVRERATNTAIKLDDLANFFYELPNLHDADNGTFIQGYDFFSSNEIQLNKSIQYINNYKDFAFWNSSTENRFGYMIKIRRDVWNVYDLSDDPIKRITLRADNVYGNSPFRIHKIDQFFIFRFKYYQTIDPIDNESDCCWSIGCVCCLCDFVGEVIRNILNRTRFVNRIIVTR